MTGANGLSRASGWKGVKRKLIKSMPYYLLILLPLAYMLVFRYYPMLGAQIAFKDYKVRLGIWASPWAGWKHFETFFKSANSWMIIKNTLVISLYSLLASFPIPILLAICLNEGDVHVGNVSLDSFESRHRTARLSIFIGDGAHRES